MYLANEKKEKIGISCKIKVAFIEHELNMNVIMRVFTSVQNFCYIYTKYIFNFDGLPRPPYLSSLSRNKMT